MPTICTSRKVRRNPNTKPMSKITKKLRLDDNADEEAICAAIDKLAVHGGDAEKRANDAEAEKEQYVAKAKEAESRAKESEEKAKKADEELAAARAQIADMKNAGAAAFVSAQVAAGRIAPQDEEAKKDAEEMYRRDPEQATRMWSRITAAKDGESVLGKKQPENKENNDLY